MKVTSWCWQGFNLSIFWILFCNIRGRPVNFKTFGTLSTNLWVFLWKISVSSLFPIDAISHYRYVHTQIKKLTELDTTCELSISSFLPFLSVRTCLNNSWMLCCLFISLTLLCIDRSKPSIASTLEYWFHFIFSFDFALCRWLLEIQ